MGELIEVEDETTELSPFGRALAELARERPEIVGLTADMGRYSDILPSATPIRCGSSTSAWPTRTCWPSPPAWPRPAGSPVARPLRCSSPAAPPTSWPSPAPIPVPR